MKTHKKMHILRHHIQQTRSPKDTPCYTPLSDFNMQHTSKTLWAIAKLGVQAKASLLEVSRNPP